MQQTAKSGPPHRIRGTIAGLIRRSHMPVHCEEPNDDEATKPRDTPTCLARTRGYAWLSSFTRGGPMRAGWNKTAASIVVHSDSASNSPMLDVPGWLENHRLPNAVAVVSAL